MTTELALCLAFAVAAFPVSRSIAVHYAIFASVNLALLGITEMDSSLLALLFAALAAVDSFLVLAGGRKILIASAFASASLSIESMLNLDWLLLHVGYVSAAVNSAIALSLAKEFVQWMRRNYGRLR